MIKHYPYALYLDSKILGTARQLVTYFDQEVFDKNNTIIYLKSYKETRRAYSQIFRKKGIAYRFMKPKELDALKDQIIFYAFNAQSNCRLVANRNLKHVFVTHGESNKVSSIKPIIRIYDHVVMAGELSLERYYKSGLFDEHDYETGRLILMGDTFLGRTGFNLNKQGEPVLFYAPTWEGGLPAENYSSLQNTELVIESITQLAKRLGLNTIVVKPHPNTGHRLKDYLRVLTTLLCTLSRFGLQVYLYPNNISIKWLNVLKLKRNRVKILTNLQNYYAQFALVDISAMESQCINENIEYDIFYSEKFLRQDMPELYFKYYENMKIKSSCDADLLLMLRDQLIGYSEPSWIELKMNQRIRKLTEYIK